MAGGRKDIFNSDLAALIFQNASISDIGDGTGLRGSSTPGSLYIALFSVSPDDSSGGTETDYTNYARVAVVRSSAGWTIVGTDVTNTSKIYFPACGVTGDTIIGFAICKGGTIGVNDAIFWGEFDSSVEITYGYSPVFEIGEFIIE